MSVTVVRYAPLTQLAINVIYWETDEGRAKRSYYITLPLNWYDVTKEGPRRALNKYAPDFDFSGVSNFDYIAPMYNLPDGRSICLNINGDPMNPFGSEDI